MGSQKFARLNLGGGLGVAEQPHQARLDLGALNESLQAIKSARAGLELWLEPGRFLVAEAGVLLARVTQTKGKDGVGYVGINTGLWVPSAKQPTNWAASGCCHPVGKVMSCSSPIRAPMEG